MKKNVGKVLFCLSAILILAIAFSCSDGIALSEKVVNSRTTTTDSDGNTVMEMTFISANVAGLPALLSSSDPDTNTPKMGPYLSNFDLVSVQEDFAYHDELIANMTQPYMTEHSGNVPLGDGMNIMSNYPIYETQRIDWDESYGFITNGADQMTPKGFVYTSIEVADGYFLDVYDLHTDADCDDGSMEARASNLRQIAEYINNRSAGKAVVVIGDTNCRYTRDQIAENLLDSTEMTDVWVELIRGGVAPEYGADALIDTENRNSANNEVVDKIFYRSGKNIELTPNFYALLEDFVDEDGNQLSDHYPITATFELTLKETYKTSETYGGGSGDGFSFLEAMDGTFPDTIAIRSGSRVDAVEFTYDGTSISAGGSGGTYYSLDLADGEYITSMQVCKAKKSWTSTYRISYVCFTTSEGNTLSGGTKGSSVYTFTAPDGYAIAGLHGMEGDEIDRIGCIYMLK
ncbi:MAG: endonuclease/exonuclease/phosphatase family protein [Treponemataceae bacterium]|nr:endonuclease/exonuclease/phosphatase family protein [Treponemataceae bacterium]